MHEDRDNIYLQERGRSPKDKYDLANGNGWDNKYITSRPEGWNVSGNGSGDENIRKRLMRDKAG